MRRPARVAGALSCAAALVAWHAQSSTSSVGRGIIPILEIALLGRDAISWWLVRVTFGGGHRVPSRAVIRRVGEFPGSGGSARS
jgi:hypothetical protein